VITIKNISILELFEHKLKEVRIGNDTSTLSGQEKEEEKEELLLPEKEMEPEVGNPSESEVSSRSSYQLFLIFINKILECLIRLLVSKFNIGLTIWEKN